MNDNHERYGVLAQTAYIRSKPARQNYVDRYYNGEYNLLDDYSNKQNTTYYDVKTGKIIMAVRGTDFSDEFNQRITDLSTDVLVGLGIEQLGTRYKSSEKILNRIRTDFPDKEVVLTGHSLGASVTQGLGFRYDLESHNFNPGSSPISGTLLKHKAMHPKTKEKVAKTHSYITKPDTVEGSVLGFDPISISNILHPLSTTHFVKQKKLPKKEQGILSPHSMLHFHPRSEVM